MQDLSIDEENENQQLYGTVSYSSQIPWILNSTVRDNILFGKEMNEEKYKEAIDSCALQTDLNQWPASDMTELGERGINLSG